MVSQGKEQFVLRFAEPLGTTGFTPGAMGCSNVYQDVQHMGKCTHGSYVFLAVQVAANLNSIHHLNESSRGEEQGFVISRRWLSVPASSAGLGAALLIQSSSCSTVPARTSSVHGGAYNKQWKIGLGEV